MPSKKTKNKKKLKTEKMDSISENNIVAKLPDNILGNKSNAERGLAIKIERTEQSNPIDWGYHSYKNDPVFNRGSVPISVN